MPVDKNGKTLKEGDIVIIRARVRQANENSTYVTVGLLSDEENETQNGFTFAGNQVEKQD